MPVYLDKATKKWFYQVSKVVDGERKRFKKRGFERKVDALAAERKFLESFDDVVHDNITFDYLIDTYLSIRKEEIKISTYHRNKIRIQKYVSDYFGKIKIKNIELKTISAWKKYLSSFQLSTDYRNRMYKDLKSILEIGVNLYNLNPKLLFELKPIKNTTVIKKDVDFFTKEEFDRFIEVIKDNDHKTLFNLLYYSGLRIGELQALTWEDFYNSKIRVNKTLTNKVVGRGAIILPPKTASANREILLPDFVNEELLKYKANKKDLLKGQLNERDYIFGGVLPYSHTSITRWKNNYCKLSGVKKIRLHDFRHSHATYLINHGADYMIVAERLGHSDVSETLNTYSHLFPSRQENLIKLLKK